MLLLDPKTRTPPCEIIKHPFIYDIATEMKKDEKNHQLPSPLTLGPFMSNVDTQYFEFIPMDKLKIIGRKSLDPRPKFAKQCFEEEKTPSLV